MHSTRRGDDCSRLHGDWKEVSPFRLIIQADRRRASMGECRKYRASRSFHPRTVGSIEASAASGGADKAVGKMKMRTTVPPMSWKIHAVQTRPAYGVIPFRSCLHECNGLIGNRDKRNRKSLMLFFAVPVRRATVFAENLARPRERRGERYYPLRGCQGNAMYKFTCDINVVAASNVVRSEVRGFGARAFLLMT